MEVINVSNPAAFAVQWTAGETGNTYQLLNPGGTAELTFGCKPAGRDRWRHTRVVAPERFGMTKPPKNHKESLSIARAYIHT